ncbi:hypothetical protein TorRG33x02_259840 [Trema orientale]|uniref:Transmembrane protein n=1 Tax=Trema orientale TaxID=63057 RepID=A0A2P5D771_TREOI|nr:hypothetical protein TorRG33x02_259840 [Trema orientale]
MVLRLLCCLFLDDEGCFSVALPSGSVVVYCAVVFCLLLLASNSLDAATELVANSRDHEQRRNRQKHNKKGRRDR